MLEDLLMVLHRLDGLPMLMGMFQDLIARDDATLHFIKDDVATELDRGAAFVAGNSAGVWLKEAEHLLLGGNFFAFEDPAARLHDHPLH